MKQNIKTQLPLFGVFAILLIIAGIFYGIGAQGDQNVYLSENNAIPKIDVSGSADQSVTPDKVVISLTVLTEGTNPESIQDENSLLMQQAKDALKAIGVKDKEIETSNYQLSPKREYDYNTRKYIDQGYQLTHTITVTTTNLDLTGQILSEAVKNGVTQVGNIYFTLSDELEKEVRDELFVKAGQNAREKAETIAQGLGVSIGDVMHISHTSYSPVYAYARNAAFAESSMVADIVPDISPQEQTVNVQLSVQFAIE